MTRDDIMRIAWDVGILMRSHKFQADPTKLERFAERIAAHEREEILKLTDSLGWVDAAAIRARGKHELLG